VSDEGPFGGDVDYRRVASVAGTVLVVVLLLPFAAYAFPGLVGADHSYVVLSGSMEPTMSPGDVIVVEDVDPEDVERGDVITYRRNGEDRPTTHRVVEVQQEGDTVAYRTAGDANEDPDSGLVRPAELEGRLASVAGVPLVIPYVGHVVLFASTRVGFALLFATPLVLFVGTELRDLVRASQEAPERDDATGDGEATDGDDTDERSLPPGVEPAIVPLDEAVDEESAESDGGGEDDSAGHAGRDDSAARDEADASGDPDDGSASVTLTRGELGLGLVVMAAFSAYSVWVAYATLAVWSLTTAGAVLTGFAMLGALFLVGGGSADEDADDEAVAAPDSEDPAATSGDGLDEADDLPPVSELFEEGTTTDESGVARADTDWFDEDLRESVLEDDPWDADGWPDDESADVAVEPRDDIVFDADPTADGTEGTSDD